MLRVRWCCPAMGRKVHVASGAVCCWSLLHERAEQQTKPDVKQRLASSTRNLAVAEGASQALHGLPASAAALCKGVRPNAALLTSSLPYLNQTSTRSSRLSGSHLTCNKMRCIGKSSAAALGDSQNIKQLRSTLGNSRSWLGVTRRITSCQVSYQFSRRALR